MSANTKLIRIEFDGVGDEFDVVSFAGTEGISQLFSYTISLAAKVPILDFDSLLEAKVHLIYGNPEAHLHGMLCSIQQGYDSAWKAGSGQMTRVDVVLVPELWKATLNVRTRFFRNMSVPDIIDQIIPEYGLTVMTNCSGDHPKRESVLQYQETDFDFLQRLCEHEGIHFHLIHDDDKEQIVYGDNNGAFEKIKDPVELPLRSAKILEGGGNLGPWGQEKTITRFQSRQRFVPKQVIMQDYNDQTPSKDLQVKSKEIGKAADGTVFYYGENYKDTGQGDALSDLRKEEILARKRLFFGASNAYRLYAGGIFKVVETDAIDSELAKEYVVTELQSEGRQPVENLVKGGTFSFSNTFTCIPESIVYRPPMKTPWPTMPPLVHAKVIASGEYSNVEDQGRYEVQFLFDLDKSGSIPIRLMEPYVGADYGFHAPLHEGVEVLCAFENGDPDRPIIVSAAHNPDFPNTVKSGNHTQSVWRSAGNNEIKMEDTSGSEQVYLHAEKDWQTKVENDKVGEIGNDEKTEVKNNRERKVGVDEKVEIGSNRNKKVGADEVIEIGGSQKITIKVDRTEKVEGNETVEVTGNIDKKVTGNTTLEVKGTSSMKYTGDQKVSMEGNSTNKITGDEETTISGGRKVTITKDDELDVTGEVKQKVGGEMKVEVGGDYTIDGKGDITLDAGFLKTVSGKGLKIEFEAKTDAEIKCKKLSLEGKDGIELKGAKYELKSDGDVTVKGSTIKLN